MEAELDESEIQRFCHRHGIAIADRDRGIGAELSFKDGPARTVVLALAESDIPEFLYDVFTAVMETGGDGYIVNRFGGFSGRRVHQADLHANVQYLISMWPDVRMCHDDIYYLNQDGTVIMHFYHHLLDSGLPVFCKQAGVAAPLLDRLNQIGAEFSVYSAR